MQKTIEFEVLSKGISIELVQGKSAIDKCCICNTDYVSKLYETLALEQVEETNTFGIFFLKQNMYVASMIFELVGDKCHLILLCSNQKERIGAAHSMMKYLIEKCKFYNISMIYLKIAKENNNKHAVQFYNSFGFTNNNSNIYVLNIA